MRRLGSLSLFLADCRRFSRSEKPADLCDPPTAKPGHDLEIVFVFLSATALAFIRGARYEDVDEGPN